MRIQSYDVARANARHRQGLHAAAIEILDGNDLILGEHLQRFEANFARYCGTAHCIGVGNGLDALTLALQAAGIRPGDEVLVPAFTFVATWSAVSLLGARPVPIDVREDGLLDPEQIVAAVTPRSRAIIPVHLYGRLADMAAIDATAREFGLIVIEDAAQAHGAERGGIRAGRFGLAGAFSFYPTKNLGGFGDGGAICTDSAELAAELRRLRNYGSSAKYRHDVLGRNTRLDDLQAALLDTKLSDLDHANARRRSVAERYRSGLLGLSGIALPDMGGVDMVWHQFVLRSRNREALRSSLAAAGIQAAIHYPIAPFDQPCYAGQYNRKRYPVAAALADTVLSLPMADYLAPAEVEHVTGAFERLPEALHA